MTETPSLAAALLAVQAALPVLHRDKVATVETQRGSYKYRYVDLASVSEVVMPLLNSNGVVFIAKPTLDDDRFVLMCSLVHVASGEREEARYPLTVPPNAPAQSIGSAVSYGRRYCLSSMVGLATSDEDDDGASASQRSAPARASRAKSTKDTPKMISEPQLRKIMVLFNESGVVDRDERLKYCAAVAGRPLTSSKDLTQAEAGTVIETLEAALAEQHTEDPA